MIIFYLYPYRYDMQDPCMVYSHPLGTLQMSSKNGTTYFAQWIFSNERVSLVEPFAFFFVQHCQYLSLRFELPPLVGYSPMGRQLQNIDKTNLSIFNSRKVSC